MITIEQCIILGKFSRQMFLELSSLRCMGHRTRGSFAFPRNLVRIISTESGCAQFFPHLTIIVVYLEKNDYLTTNLKKLVLEFLNLHLLKSILVIPLNIVIRILFLILVYCILLCEPGCKQTSF